MEILFANFLTFVYFAMRSHMSARMSHRLHQLAVHYRKSEEEYELIGKKEICKKEGRRNKPIFKLRYMHAMRRAI